MGLMGMVGDVARRGALQDFATRFEQGQHEDNLDEGEAHDRFEQVSRDADREECNQSARLARAPVTAGA